MRARRRILGLAVVVGLSLIGPPPSHRLAFADGEGVAPELPGQPDEPEPAGQDESAAPSAADAAVEPVSGPEEVETSDSPTGAEVGSDAPAVAAGSPNPLDPDATARGAGASGRRVRVRLDVTGELFVAPGGDEATVRAPVAMSARFDFDEHPGTAGGDARREYRDATAALELAGRKTRTTLSSDARRLRVARRGTTAAAYLETGFLSCDEADLLETPFDSLLIDELLPTVAVRLEERWDVPADLTAGLLAIDTVESGGLTARIVEVAAGRARVVIEGIVDGAVDGVPTHVTVEGTYAAPFETEPRGENEGAATQAAAYMSRGPVSQVAVVVRERRQPSHVAPGFDVEARLVVARGGLPVAVDESRAPQETAATAGRRRGPGAPGRLWHRDPAGRFDLVHDARWKRVEDGPHGLVLRFVDHGALVGQCSIMCLPGKSAAEPPAVDDVRRDFERTLAGQISRIESADESVREDGARVVRVEAAGTAGGLSFRWMHYVIAGAGGRAGVTFMCEAPLRQRFGDADRNLVEGLRLLAGEAGGGPEGGTAALPDGGVGPRR